MAIHNQLYSEYQSFPGRQIEYVVVPRKHPHYFFEGIQSVDATNNSDEVNHGQFGFKQDVIIQRDYSNTSGTVSLKEFNNISYVLRGMTGADPTKTFIFDPSRLEHVDVCANIYNKARDKVLRSTWLVDFTPSLSENESLDDIQTRDLNYTAIRKIDFEGYQIVHQEWIYDSGDDDEPVQGKQDFTLKYPAVIDPVVAFAEIDPRTSYSKDAGMVIGKGRHELCPIQFMLRVIVNGEVLNNPQDATVTTTVVGNATTSKLHLSTPLPDGKNTVIAFWLSDGNHPKGATAITSAPVMSSMELWNAATDPTTTIQLDGFIHTPGLAYNTGTPNTSLLTDSWDGGLRLQFSAPLGNIDGSGNVQGLERASASAPFNNFTFRYRIVSTYDPPIASSSGSLGQATEIGTDGATTATVLQLDGTGGLITRNILSMKLDATTYATQIGEIDAARKAIQDIINAKENAIYSGTSVPQDSVEIHFYITYDDGGTGVLPLYGYDNNELTPVHTLHLVMDENGMRSVLD